jgi:energy-coupling factor transport system ATP-binding protein
MTISFRDVSFSYPSGVEAVRGVSLEIADGEAVAIIGENGAGKTTLVRHINGLLRPTRGEVQVGDWDTCSHTVAALARRAGYVFQNPDDQLFERTVRAEVAFGPRNLGCVAGEIAARVADALARVGLADMGNVHPYDLHPSQRKLVALAAALAMRTPILILDEPTTGQDTPGVARLSEIVAALKAEGTTLITITHDIDFCAEHFERVIVMAQGRVLADGPAADVLAQPAPLAEAEVDPPQLMRLAAALGLNAAPLTVEDFVDALGARHA